MASGGTLFEGMSHEQMLAWLNQANAGMVQTAASKLESAAEEIARIAEELGTRPDRVEWKGEGADTFRYWASDLANATWRLSEFSKGASGWLNQASDSIALAQSAIPRDAPAAQANLDAAYAAHNDPDAPAIRSRYAQNLAELTADREKVRQEAAAQMTKLAQSYAWSATQLNALERPRFPPPPKAFVPADVGAVDSKEADKAELDGPSGVNSTAGTVHATSTTSGAGSSAGVSSLRHVAASGSQPDISGESLPPVRTAIDSVGTLPSPTPLESSRDSAEPIALRGATPQTGPVPALFGGGQTLPVNNPALRASMPSMGRSAGTPTPVGHVPSVPGGTGNGIVGGRPVLPSEGRPTGAVPRGMVVGGESAPPRNPMGPMGQTPGMGTLVGRDMGTPGTASGGRSVSPPGGIVGGRPMADSGVVGANHGQRSGRAGARVPGSGVIGSGGTGTGPSNAITGGTTAAGRSGEGHGGARAAAHPSRTTSFPSTRNGNGRPYGVAEDEETWRRNRRPTVPPVVD
ncbi:translation initiation factor IF-2 [Streptomyces niveiscabiei]|uniref:translation initiation factor IF-2 n=1 Tax=Streptomyces niveiscabiei TaxID=164115 RepID=UPI0029AB8757|nr:translation initiation factor IF-2 [Streptomyces niveiscabiei]MDX3383853.1 translation initiation factor IF-2 [Streptomyces niveiscabiei]